MTFLLATEKIVILWTKQDKVILPPPNGPKNPWEQAFNELDTPKKSDFSIGTVTERLKRFQADYFKREPGQRTGWHPRDVRELIKNDIDFEDPVIRGPVQIAKGEESVLALNYEQVEAVGTIFNFASLDLLKQGANYYVSLESTGENPKKVEAKLKHASIRPSTPNHLIVSSAAAKELGIEGQNKDIRIVGAYQKVEDIDLDKI